jgi:hypothetical protein
MTQISHRDTGLPSPTEQSEGGGVFSEPTGRSQIFEWSEYFCSIQEGSALGDQSRQRALSECLTDR